jgi:Icc-related predicted phosphoesterase
MLLFAFSDLHNSDAGLDFILSEIEHRKPDLILCAGDVTTFGPREFGEKTLRSIPIKTLGVPGNCDPPDLHDIYNLGNSTNLHGNSTDESGFSFTGWGGSNISLNTPFENPEEQILSDLDPVMEHAAVSGLPLILLAHCPPLGFVDTVPTGMHVGCHSIAEMVEKHRPVLTICGHIHEAKGIVRDEQRNLIIVNVGPSKLSSAAIITLGETENVKKDPLNNIDIELLG